MLLAFLLLVDLYAYQAVKTAFRASTTAQLVYWIFSGLVYLTLVYLFIIFDRNKGPQHGGFQYVMALTIIIGPQKCAAYLYVWRRCVARAKR
ncbi:MAG: hypothetical protein U5L96_19210 [Owenweeksia sp.]|nr:hypothetical protein [Owenweeksia sp.]